MKPLGVHIALLRGLNVGGKNRLRMTDLAVMFVEAGCRDVHTYIQSGNVVFRATPTIAKRVPSVIGQTMADRFGCTTPVVTRTVDELLQTGRSNPFLVTGTDTDTLHVVFLSGRPSGAAAKSLDRHRSPPDELRVRGRELYLRCPGGLARTKFTNQYFETKLGTTSTIRTWRTVTKLQELTATVAATGLS